MAAETVRVGRRTIQLSNPQKLMFPDDGITKSDLVDYYLAVGSHMVPHVRDRLMTLERYPDGVGGSRFYSKQIPSYFPEWIGREKVAKEGGEVTHVVANEVATLVYLANQACITAHIGLSRIDALDRPDQLIVDLDPSREDFAAVRRAAHLARELLDELGLVSFVKTTGSRGLHIVVPLDRKSPFRDVRRFAADLARVLASRDPKNLTVETRKDKRKGRLFVDWLRNSYGQHAVAPYAVRARPGAPVALPVEWDELDDRGFHARRYTIRSAADRLESGPGAWAGWRKRARSLSGPRRRLDELLEDQPGPRPPTMPEH